MSVFSILKRGLKKTATGVVRSITGLFSGERTWDAATFEELEYALIAADFGVTAAGMVVAELKERYQLGKIQTSADIFSEASALVAELLKRHTRALRRAEPGTPTVILMVGVNGSGKTTTIGKMAAQWRSEGKKVLLGAADTFRAAAVEQLRLWGEKTGSPVIAGAPCADPASVAFSAVQAGREQNMDFVLIDTAGRQHNKKALMDELSKITRSIAKACPGAPHEVFLTLDASLGSNALAQAREFGKAASLTGLVLTKLDGTGKGGMAAAVQCELELPTFFTGVGEAPEDLQPFDPELYARALFDRGDE